MPTTPVDIEVETDPNGTVRVLIEIAGSSGSAAPVLQGSQVSGGEFNVDGLKDSWVTSEDLGHDVFRENWYVLKTELDQWKTADPEYTVKHQAAFTLETPDEFLKRMGQVSSDYHVISQVLIYQALRRRNDLPVPPSGGACRVQVFDNSSGSFELGGYLWRSAPALGLWSDTWAFKPGFKLASATVEVKFVEDTTSPNQALNWRNYVATRCMGGQFVVTTYPKP